MKKIILSIFMLTSIATMSSQAQSTEKALPNADGNYALVVNFISQASGPNRDALKRLKELIDETQTKYKKEIRYNLGRWGREGETDFSFDMHGLSKRQTKRFLKTVKTEMAKFKLVSVAENAIPPSERNKQKTNQ